MAPLDAPSFKTKLRGYFGKGDTQKVGKGMFVLAAREENFLLIQVLFLLLFQAVATAFSGCFGFDVFFKKGLIHFPGIHLGPSGIETHP